LIIPFSLWNPSGFSAPSPFGIRPGAAFFMPLKILSLGIALLLRPSDAVHGIEYFFLLAADLDADGISSEDIEFIGELSERNVQRRDIDNHHHIEISLDDGLRNIKNVDFSVCKECADTADNADLILSYNGNDSLIHGVPLLLKYVLLKMRYC
jgi:hypothetical protein